MAPPPHTHTHTHTNTDMTCDYSGPRTSMNRRFVVPGRPLSPPLSLRLTEKQICSRVSLWWCVSSPPTKLHCHSFPFLFQVLCSINSWQVSVKQGWSTAGSTYTSSEPPPPPSPSMSLYPSLSSPTVGSVGRSWLTDDRLFGSVRLGRAAAVKVTNLSKLRTSTEAWEGWGGGKGQRHPLPQQKGTPSSLAPPCRAPS